MVMRGAVSTALLRKSYNAKVNPASVPCDTKVKGNTMTPSSIASYLLVYGRPELCSRTVFQVAWEGRSVMGVPVPIGKHAEFTSKQSLFTIQEMLPRFLYKYTNLVLLLSKYNSNNHYNQNLYPHLKPQLLFSPANFDEQSQTMSCHNVKKKFFYEVPLH